MLKIAVRSSCRGDIGIEIPKEELVLGELETSLSFVTRPGAELG